MCNETYLGSPEFYLFALQIASIIEIPVFCLGTYCILFKTPNQMQSVKWLLFNLHMWTAFSDFVISFLCRPLILLPFPVGYSMGVFAEYPGTLLYLCNTLLAGSGASILSIYENRFHILFAENTRWSRFRKPFLLSMFIMTPLFYLPLILNLPDQMTARSAMLKVMPCLPNYHFKTELFVLCLDIKIHFFSIAIATTVVTVSSLVFLLLTIYHLRFTFKRSISNRNHQLQKKLTYALIIQTTFLVSVCLVPISTIILAFILQVFNQMITNFALITLSLHGVGSTIVMVWVHTPYRQFVFDSTLSIFVRPRNSGNVGNGVTSVEGGVKVI